MTKVGIIGIGHVGSTVAHTLIERNIATDINLYDHNEKLLIAEQRDLLIGQVGTNRTVDIHINERENLKDLDVIVFTAGDITILSKEGATRFDELNFTSKAVNEWGPIIRESAFNGVIIDVTNPCDVITRLLQETTKLPRNQVFGTGTSLDSARYMQVISERLGVSPDSVSAYMLGEHGETQFGAWSTATVGQQPLTDFLSTEELEEFAGKSRYDGWLVFNGKGYTSYGIASEACQLVQAVATDSKRVFPVAAYSEADKLYVGHLAVIGAGGVERDFEPKLSDDEKVKWDKSVAWIQEMYETITAK